MKTCSLCQKEKPESEFYAVHKRSKKILHSRCRNCIKKDRKKDYREKGGREKMREYRKTPRGARVLLRARDRYEMSKRGKKTRKQYQEKIKKQTGSWAERTEPEKKIQVAARNAVNSAIRYNRMPPAGNFPCIKCGDKAKEYHHHNGYAQEYWLDVVPMCIKCHRNLDTKIHQSV